MKHYSVKEFDKLLRDKLTSEYGVSLEVASNQQIYRALASTVRDQIMQKWMISREERKTNKSKRLYYLSVEFLMGRSLYCNILNLVSTDAYKQALAELNIDLDAVLKEEEMYALVIDPADGFDTGTVESWLETNNILWQRKNAK